MSQRARLLSGWAGFTVLFGLFVWVTTRLLGSLDLTVTRARTGDMAALFACAAAVVVSLFALAGIWLLARLLMALLRNSEDTGEGD